MLQNSPIYSVDQELFVFVDMSFFYKESVNSRKFRGFCREILTNGVKFAEKMVILGQENSKVIVIEIK